MPAPLGRWCPLSLLPWPSLFPVAPWPVVVGGVVAPPEKLAPHVLPRRVSVVAWSVAWWWWSAAWWWSVAWWR